MHTSLLLGATRRRGTLGILASGAMIVMAVAAHAAPGTLESGPLPEPKLEPRPTQDVILGVVTDQTMTRIGREFYQGFLAAWRNFGPDAEQHNLAIYERPSARWGSLVWVEKNRQRVFQAFVYPGRMNYDKLGEQAAWQVYGRIGQLDMEKLLFRDPDLGGEEF